MKEFDRAVSFEIPYSGVRGGFSCVVGWAGGCGWCFCVGEDGGKDDDGVLCAENDG